MSHKKLRIIAPLSQDFFSSNTKAYTGAQHFSSLFVQYFDQTKHTLIGVAFEKPPKEIGVTCRKDIRNNQPWLWISLYLPTLDILAIAEGRENKKTKEIVKKISKQFLALKPDIFFLNGLSALTYLLAKAAKQAGIPIVSTFHGIWTIEAAAHPALAKHRRAISLRKKVEQEIVTLSQKNIFLTDLSYKIFSQVIRTVPEKKRLIIPIPFNPIFSEKNPKPPNPQSKIKHIGLIGRWDPIKNHEAYLALAREAKKQKLPWLFHAATTPFAAVKALQPVLQEYKKTIQITEHLSPQKLKTFYRNLDAVVTPSHFETFCGVVMEALLQEIPVLVSPKVGMSDILRLFNLPSWITTFSSPSLVIKRLQKVMSKPVPFSIREYLLKHNQAEDIFQQYEKVFLEVYKQTSFIKGR